MNMTTRSDIEHALDSLRATLGDPTLVGSVTVLVFPERLELVSVGLRAESVQQTLVSAAAMNQLYLEEKDCDTGPITLQ